MPSDNQRLLAPGEKMQQVSERPGNMMMHDVCPFAEAAVESQGRQPACVARSWCRPRFGAEYFSLRCVGSLGCRVRRQGENPVLHAVLPQASCQLSDALRHTARPVWVVSGVDMQNFHAASEVGLKLPGTERAMVKIAKSTKAAHGGLCGGFSVYRVLGSSPGSVRLSQFQATPPKNVGAFLPADRFSAGRLGVRSTCGC
ncbi:MAG: hypothetical protein RIQ71_226 [Verrucomicrobiota bacterium]